MFLYVQLLLISWHWSFSSPACSDIFYGSYTNGASIDAPQTFPVVLEDELLLVHLLHQMNQLRGQIANQTVIDQLEALNHRALDIVEKRLNYWGVAYRRAPLYDHKEMGFDPSFFHGHHLLQSEMAGIFDLFQPVIEIIKDPLNPAVFNRIIDNFDGRIVFSAQIKSFNPSYMGGVLEGLDRNIFVYPLESLFEESLTLSTILLHETRHLYFSKMRRLGKETLFNISLAARGDDRLQEQEPGFYDQHFSFEEISTWEKSIRYFQRGALHTNSTTKIYRNNQVYHIKDPYGRHIEFLRYRYSILLSTAIAGVNAALRKIHIQPDAIHIQAAELENKFPQAIVFVELPSSTRAALSVDLIQTLESETTTRAYVTNYLNRVLTHLLSLNIQLMQEGEVRGVSREENFIIRHQTWLESTPRGT
jgi:hypothetical protein